MINEVKTERENLPISYFREVRLCVLSVFFLHEFQNSSSDCACSSREIKHFFQISYFSFEMGVILNQIRISQKAYFLWLFYVILLRSSS